MIIRYTLAWLLLVFIAIANGALREFTYGKLLSELRSHQLSTLLALIFFAAYVFGLTKLWPIESSSQAITIGCIWLVLTIAFEFLFGHFAMGHSWEKLLFDYNLFAGRLWILVLIWTTTAPYIFYLMQTRGG